MTLQKAVDLEIQGAVPPIVPTDFDEFDEFSGVDFDAEFHETDDTKKIPFCQIVVTDLSLTRWAAMPDKDFPYGIFIPVSQAEIAGFTPDHNWMMESPCLSGKVRKFGGPTSTPGYFVKPDKKARIVVLAQSVQEVYCNKKFAGKTSKVCLGPYSTGFDTNGIVKSEAGLAFDAAEKNTGWQNSQRYLFYVLGEDNEPLSERPFSLRISNTFGIGFKNELKMSYLEAIEASKIHGEKKKAQTVALAMLAMAKAIKLNDVKGGITAEAELRAARRRPVQSLTNRDRSRIVYNFEMSMRENLQGVGTVYVSGRAQPAKWEGNNPEDKPKPFTVNRTKKSGELIYAIGIEPTAYPRLLVQANSVLGKQIVTDLEVYADFKVAPNLRKLIEEVPVAAAAVSISDFDPNAEDFTFEDEYEVEYTQLEEDPMFSGILIQLSKATEVEQIGKWREWALKPKQASLFTEEYPSYEQDLDVLGERHRKTLPVKTLA